MKLYSLERRRDRYFILYIWKIINHFTPNISDNNGSSIATFTHIRRGKLCCIPPINNRAPVYVRTLKENSLIVYGSRLFNSIPKELREYEGSLHGFKRLLDSFLTTVVDKPALPHYMQPATSNSLLAQLAQQRAERR